MFNSCAILESLISANPEKMRAYVCLENNGWNYYNYNISDQPIANFKKRIEAVTYAKSQNVAFAILR